MIQTKRGDRTRCVATPKHIDNAQKLLIILQLPEGT
nr:MAG TPA: hypothetical protein [Caudoviricetes sp.]